MATYWLHVNHPTSKAMLHVEDGCAWVRRAAARVAAGEPYGPSRGDRSGHREPFETKEAAERAQEATGKARQDRCRLCWR